MRIFWKIAVPVACVGLICVAAITWKMRSDRGVAGAAKTARISAERGDAKAQYDLGHMYYHGKGVQKNFAEAARWYREAADQGDAKAQYGIGYMYHFGQGVPQDYTEAVRWFRKAADQGYAKAQDNLASMYGKGQGVPQDYSESIRWYRKSADQGDATGQDGLGFMYYYGQGVPQDRAEADRWYHKAAAQGDAYAQRVLGLKGRIPGTFSKIYYSVITLGCLLLLIGSLFPGRRSRRGNYRAVALTALLGLTSVGLSLYWIYGSFPSLSAINVFFFAKDLLAGVFVALVISLFDPKRTKIVLGIVGILFIGFNLFAMIRDDLSRLAPATRFFCAVNGLLLGMLITLAIFLWRTSNRPKEDQNIEGDVAASEIPVDSGAQAKHV